MYIKRWRGGEGGERKGEEETYAEDEVDAEVGVLDVLLGDDEGDGLVRRAAPNDEGDDGDHVDGHRGAEQGPEERNVATVQDNRREDDC